MFRPSGTNEYMEFALLMRQEGGGENRVHHVRKNARLGKTIHVLCSMKANGWVQWVGPTLSPDDLMSQTFSSPGNEEINATSENGKECFFHWILPVICGLPYQPVP